MKIRWVQYLLWLVIAVSGAGSALTACGQKGALYHPDSTAVEKEPFADKVPGATNIPPATSEPSS